MSYKSFDEINQKIKENKVVVVTASEIKGIVEEKGPKAAAKEIDVVTTGTFGPMCSSGAFLNFGHSDPPIRMGKVWLNDVPALAGLAAVDAYVGATELSETKGLQYGGAHVIHDLLEGKSVRLRASSHGTDCYPSKEVESDISLSTLNQAYMYNPRNCSQNYGAATNLGERTLHTYMGTLLPNMGNVNYTTAGELSPLLCDPMLRTVGIGSRVFLGGAMGHVAWEGTQSNPAQERTENEVPVGPGATLALMGNLKQMDPRFVRAAVFQGYGVSLFLGVGIPIPILDEDMAAAVAVRDKDIFTKVFDYGVPHRTRPVVAKVSYGELRSGHVTINGKSIPTSPLSSLRMAREIADILKTWIEKGAFMLQKPISPLPADGTQRPLPPCPTNESR